MCIDVLGAFCVLRGRMIVLLKASQREVTKYVDLLTYHRILTWRLEGPFGTQQWNCQFGSLGSILVL